jgi:16S rRNA (guanine(966)-N(2))-methyltransferase RsmD
LRVIAGIAKKCKLVAPDGLVVRPTADRVKEALFSILGGSVIESKFLDIFAGSGGVGIEALSRGATQVVFVEKEMKNFQIIKKNLLSTGLTDRARCIQLSADKAITLLGAEKTAFDLVFMDPPYARRLVADTLTLLTKNHLVKSGGIVIVESGAEIPAEDLPESLGMYRQGKYGNTMLSFYYCQ